MSQKKILIVDDDPNYSDMLKAFLEEEGHLVWRVGDASALAARVEKGDLPDLFIIDMQMPGGGGPAAVKNLRSSPATDKIPIVICSGMPVHQQEKWFRELPAVRFAQKPVELLLIRDYVWELLKVRPPEPPKPPKGD